LSGVELALILKTVAEHALIMACLISDLWGGTFCLFKLVCFMRCLMFNSVLESVKLSLSNNANGLTSWLMFISFNLEQCSSPPRHFIKAISYVTSHMSLYISIIEKIK
jgi:hypothetical protein